MTQVKIPPVWRRKMTRTYSVVREGQAAGDGIISEDDDATEFPKLRGTPPVRVSLIEAQRFMLETPLDFREVYLWGAVSGFLGVKEGDKIVEHLGDPSVEKSYPVKHVIDYPARNDQETILRLIVEVLP